MGGAGDTRKLAPKRSQTFTARGSRAWTVPEVERPDLARTSATAAPAQQETRRAQARTAEEPRTSRANSRDVGSILNDDQFGQRYIYGAADGAADPWRLATAVGWDFGSYVLGGKWWKANSGVEGNQELCTNETCSIMRGRLRKQAEERLAKEAAAKEAAAKEAAAEVAVAKEAKQGDILAEESLRATTDDAKVHESESSSSSTSQDEKAKDTGGDHDLSRVSTTSSYTSADIVSSGAGHYEPNNDVILRLETMTAAEVRFLNITLWTWLVVALAFLLFEFIQKLVDENAAVRSYNTPIINSVMGGICFVLLSVLILCHGYRVYQTRVYKKIWKPRRRRFSTYVTVELFTQWINLIFFLLPNLESFGPNCFRIISNAHIGYYSLVRWTCWNTLFMLSLIHAHNSNHVTQEHGASSSAGRRSSLQRRKGVQNERQRTDVAVMDLGFWTYHWWKIAYWCLTEASILLCVIYYTTTGGKPGSRGVHIDDPDSVIVCQRDNFHCEISNTSIGLVSIMVFFVLLYFVMYCSFVYRTLQQLQQRSNVEYKIQNVVVRLQMRLRLPAFGFFILSLLLLWYVKPFSCNSMVDTWFGMLPGQLAATVSVMMLMFVGTPKSCGGNKPILQVWLQEFAWTETEKQHKMERRNLSLPPDQRDEIAKEPMFCVETMMICLYWSLLIYDFHEVEDSKLSLEEACGLFNPPLEEFEIFTEKSLDTKVLLAWNRVQMVLAFRGTASLANVVADVQAWRTIHHPKRGTCWNRPMVHSGFDKAWRNNKLNERVVARIKEIIMTGGVDKTKLKFFVTGHSLGGALATLAAYDMRAIGKKYGNDCKVSCYTFGAPRTGNHAFAREFEEMVPDCWHVINDQDVVARGAKFWRAYKRGGHRVLINSLGDLIVRPNAIEASIRLIPCSGSVQQHLLTSYLRSLLQVLISQFSSKRILGGMTGVVQLARDSTAIKRLLLEEAELTFEKLQYMSRWGPDYAPKVAAIAELPLKVRKSTREAKSRKLTNGAEETTRGGFLLGCCAPTSVKIKEAKGDPDTNAEDANPVDGGDVKSASKAKGDENV